MPGDVVISVEKLSKRYLVGHQSAGAGDSYQSLREALVRHGRNMARKTLDMARGRQIIQGDEVEEFWALKDVSFEVGQGEVVGIIGRNGAGKSTLLKVLSRITEPTKGRITLRGRVAALLEVGTGFHPELTGRENIFLNGAILGMTKAEIRAKFDEIVDFSEVEKFLDLPVKRYSSGMHVRLSFAVAAHLDPEILIVDEVLAVGDVNFQKKCLGKMKDVTKTDGRTVLFVSHNMSAIRSLCTRAILLRQGGLSKDGNPIEVIEDYLGANDAASFDGLISDDLPRVYETGEARVRRIQLLGDEGRPTNHVAMGSPMEWLVQFEVLKPVDDLLVELGMLDTDMNQLTQSLSVLHGRPGYNLTPGRYEVRVRIDAVFHPGSYSMLVGLHHQTDGATVDWIERAVDFEVMNGPSDSPYHYSAREVRAFIRPPETWTEPKRLVEPA